MIKNREVYSKHLPAYLVAMDIMILRHLPRLLHVICNYIEIYDGPNQTARLNALSAMNTTIVIAWPRIGNHCDTIFKALVKVLYNVTVDKTDVNEDAQDLVINRTTQCLTILRCVVPEQTELYLKAIKCDNLSDAFQKCINRAKHEVCDFTPLTDKK